MNDEFSQTNTNLFAGFVVQYIQNNHKPPEILKDLLHLIKTYIDIIENPTKIKSKGASLL